MAKIPTYPKINYLDASESFILTTTTGTYQTDSSVIAGAHERLYNHDDYIDSTELAVFEQQLNGEFSALASDLTSSIATLEQELVQNAIDSTAYADAIGAEAAANAANEASNAVGAHLLAIDHTEFLTSATVPRTLITDVYTVTSIAERDALTISDGTSEGVWIGDVIIVNDGTQNDSFIFDGTAYQDLGYNNSVIVHENTYDHTSFMTLADTTQAISDYGAITASDATVIHEILGGGAGYATVLAADFENANSDITDFPDGFSTMQVSAAGNWPTPADAVVVTSKPSNIAGEQTYIDEAQQIYKRSWISETGFIDPNDTFPTLNSTRWGGTAYVAGDHWMFEDAFGGEEGYSKFWYKTTDNFKIEVDISDFYFAGGEPGTGLVGQIGFISTPSGDPLDVIDEVCLELYYNTTSNQLGFNMFGNAVDYVPVTVPGSRTGAIDGTAVLEWNAALKTMVGFFLHNGTTQYGFSSSQLLTMPDDVFFWIGRPSGSGATLINLAVDTYTTVYGTTFPQDISEWGAWQELATVTDVTQALSDSTTFVNNAIANIPDPVLFNQDLNTYNTVSFAGIETLSKSADATNNIMIGPTAGNNTMTGDTNILIGYDVGKGITYEYGNLFIGLNTAPDSTEITDTIVIGQNAAEGANFNWYDVYVGPRAGSWSSGALNVGIGYESGSNQSGFGNTAINGGGGNALGAETYGVVTINSSPDLLIGEDSVFIGTDAGKDTTDAGWNVCIGSQAGRLNMGEHNNVCIGNQAGLGIGYPGVLGTWVPDGGGHVAIGYRTLIGAGQGALNIAIGYLAAEGPTLPVVQGHHSNTIAIGREAARYLTDGTSNICIGEYAGDNLSNANNNICIGRNAKPSSATASHQCIIGGTGVDAVKVGIGGNNNPQHSLDVAGNINFTGTLYQDGTAVTFGGGGGGIQRDSTAYVNLTVDTTDFAVIYTDITNVDVYHNGIKLINGFEYSEWGANTVRVVVPVQAGEDIEFIVWE